MILKHFIKGYLLCFILLISHGLLAQSQDLYFYIDPFDPSNIIRVDLSKKAVILGDIVDSAFVCNESDSFYCFSSKSITFAVPTKNIRTQKEWTFRGVKYKNNGIGNIKFLGTSIEVYRIVTDRVEAEYNFLYSEEHGLIAIGAFIKETEQGRVYLLEEENGFASSNKRCNKR